MTFDVDLCKFVGHDHSCPEIQGQGQRSNVKVEMRLVGPRVSAILAVMSINEHKNGTVTLGLISCEQLQLTHVVTVYEH